VTGPGSYSIRVNQQWRICVRWTTAGPEDVQEMRDRSDFDVVLLSADSLETIKRTHSSYFDTRESFETLLPTGGVLAVVAQ
jgi:hypothetical protein